MSLMSHNEARRSSTFWREKHQQVFAMIRLNNKINNFPKNIHEQKAPVQCMIDDGLRQRVQIFFEFSMWPFPSFCQGYYGLEAIFGGRHQHSSWHLPCQWLWDQLFGGNHERKCVICVTIAITICVYMQRCKDCIDYQVEDDVDMRPNSVSGLFPLGCILSHDCRANTVHTFESFEVSRSTCIANELISMTY